MIDLFLLRTVGVILFLICQKNQKSIQYERLKRLLINVF